MNTVKYFFLARTIRLFLQFGFLFAIIGVCVNLFTAIFSHGPRLRVNDGMWTMGQTYFVKASLDLYIPDTTTYYENGYRRSNVGEIKSFEANKSKIKEKIINSFPVVDGDITISSAIKLMENNVKVKIESKNWRHRVFWLITDQLDLIVSGLFLLLLIKLTNRYMDGDIFQQRTFILVSLMGLLLVSREIVNLVVGFVNMKVIGWPQLNTLVVGKTNYDPINLRLDFLSTLSFSNIGVGVLIVLLAQVLKEAIEVKKENELTI